MERIEGDFYEIESNELWSYWACVEEAVATKGGKKKGRRRHGVTVACLDLTDSRGSSKMRCVVGTLTVEDRSNVRGKEKATWRPPDGFAKYPLQE